MWNNGTRGRGWNPSRSSTNWGLTRGGRSGYSGRGGRGNRGGSWYKPNPQSRPDTSLHPLGDLVAVLDNSSLDLAALTSTATPSISDCQYVTSYNWLNDRNPTIVVPGRPPLWTPLAVPRTLSEDSGNYFRDPNAARFPSYPTEPAVQSILTTKPDFPRSTVDIFACGSTMGNLLRFVRSIDRPFRFSVEVVNNTVFFIRKENAPDELLDGVRGYGHTFPENYTTWENDVRGSETHQRVVQYQFGGFNCLVRYECDGYLGNSASGDVDPSDGSEVDQDSDEEDIAQIFGGVSVGQHVSKSNDLTLKPGGSEVPQESIFDLKTRSGKYNKQINMGDQLPTLWVKQIPNFVVAYHNGAGLFENSQIQVHDVREDIQRWEADNAAMLKRMAAVMRKIVDFAKASEEHRIDIYCPSVDRLEIRKQLSGVSRVLPPSLMTAWVGHSSISSEVAERHPNSGGKAEEDDHSEEDEMRASFSSDEYPDGYQDDPDYKEPDFTACSADDCGYCGRCPY